jgi:ribosomal protein S18 acetylase RimI-like enzyme
VDLRLTKGRDLKAEGRRQRAEGKVPGKGFFCVRDAGNYLYIHTIQLVSSYRNKGYGTFLLQQIEEIARAKNLLRIRLSVFKEIPAQRLYRRLGYQVLEEDEYFIRMENILQN